MILRYEHGKLVEQRTYREALHLEGDVSPVISIVGAGGKTTTIHQIAQEYVREQIPVAVTTTTHMKLEKKPYFLLEEEWMTERRMEVFYDCMRREGQVWFGRKAIPKHLGDVEKIQSPSEMFLDQVRLLHIPLLIEADGARKLPCKAPGVNEPVLLQDTTMLIVVYGLDAIGKPIQEICFRPERVAEILQKKVTDDIQPEDLALLAMDERGGKKGLSEQQQYVVILNKADNEKRIKDAKCICERIAEIENENTDKRGRGSGNRNCSSLVSMWT